MKLKTVTVTFDFVMVVDDNEINSNVTAQDCVENVLRDMSKCDIEIDLSDYISGSVYGWDDDCIPYGGDGATKIGKLINAAA